MADNAFAWAKSRPGLWRINPCHKEEEARLVISETFLCENQRGNEMKSGTSFEANVTRLCYCLHTVS
jgi:hypothetical protein